MYITATISKISNPVDFHGITWAYLFPYVLYYKTQVIEYSADFVYNLLFPILPWPLPMMKENLEPRTLLAKEPTKRDYSV